MADAEQITGVYERTIFRARDSDYIIGCLTDGRFVKGNAPDGTLVPDFTYLFHGRWRSNSRGEQFAFEHFLLQAPHSKEGVVAYLVKFASGVGPVTAQQLWDTFGSDAVKVLRTQPEIAAQATRYLTVEKAKQAARELQEVAAVEDTRIELTNLFYGRGFPGALVEQCIDRWGAMAPERIRRDPFTLLVHELPGAGWARCDRLYADLGLPPGRLKRQMICLWHALREESSGHTWIAAEFVEDMMKRHIAGVKVTPARAAKMGVRAGWIRVRKDDAGKVWIAEKEKADAEEYLAKRLIELAFWEMPDARVRAQ